MALTDQLLTVARTYAEARSLSLSRVSTIVFNDGKKIEAIENGADLQTQNFERAMGWFAENWPDGARWPADVPRPRDRAEAS
jgi:hypothetical protein